MTIEITLPLMLNCLPLYEQVNYFMFTQKIHWSPVANNHCHREWRAIEFKPGSWQYYKFIMS